MLRITICDGARLPKNILILSFLVTVLSHGFASAAGGISPKQALRHALSSEQCFQLPFQSVQSKELQQVYASNNHDLIWSHRGVIKDTANLLLSEIRRSGVHGLRPGFYQIERLKELSQSDEKQDLACFDSLLSSALVLYANDIANGHIRAVSSPDHTLVEPLLYKPAAIFAETDSVKTLQVFLRSLLVTDDRYIRLITKLAEFIRLESQNAWPEIVNKGSQSNPKVDMNKVRQLLLFTGDLGNKERLDTQNKTKHTRAALSNFQVRHGLTKTGKINAATFRELAMPLERRIELIRINLERRRWQNKNLGPDHLYINVADQSVRIVRNGKKSGSAKHVLEPEQKDLPTFFGSVFAVSKNDQDQLILHIRSDATDSTFAKPLETAFLLNGSLDENLVALLGEDNASRTVPVSGEQTVLQTPIGVFVTYLTVWANKDGSINFRPDRFERDSELAELLNK